MSTTSDSEQALLQALEALPSDVNPFSFLIQLLEPTLPKWHLGLSIVLLIAAVAWGVSLAASLTTLYIRLFRRKERWLFKCTQSSFGTLWISNINLIWPILQLPHFACIELAITCLVYTGFTGKSVPRADMLVKLVYIPIYILAAIQSWNCVESCVSTMLQNVAQNDFLGSQPSKIRLTWIGPLVNAICIVGVIASVPILNLAFGVIEEKYAIRAMNISAELTEKLQVLASEWTGGLPLNELLPLVSTFQSLQANIALERLYLHRWSIMLLCAVLFLFVTWTPAALLQMGVLWRQIRQLKATRIASIAGTASQGAAISQLEGQISVGPERPSTATQGKVTQPLFQVKSMQNDPDSHLRRLESVLNNVILTSAVFTGAVVSLIPVAALTVKHTKDDSNTQIVTSVAYLQVAALLIITVFVVPIDLAILHRTFLSNQLDAWAGTRSQAIVSNKGSRTVAEKVVPLQISLDRSVQVNVDNEELKGIAVE